MKPSYYDQGLEHAQRAEWGEAMTCFKRALQEDPASLAMLQDIVNYYHKDNFNP